MQTHTPTPTPPDLAPVHALEAHWRLILCMKHNKQHRVQLSQISLFRHSHSLLPHLHSGMTVFIALDMHLQLLHQGVVYPSCNTIAGLSAVVFALQQHSSSLLLHPNCTALHHPPWACGARSPGDHSPEPVPLCHILTHHPATKPSLTCGLAPLYTDICRAAAVPTRCQPSFNTVVLIFFLTVVLPCRQAACCCT
jgi:hypothetical protein